ncbi:hypothetical protein YC2023_100577 [Brassica napus]
MSPGHAEGHVEHEVSPCMRPEPCGTTHGRLQPEADCQSVPLMIKRKCCPELVKVYGFRSVEVLLDTPPGSPKNCPEAKRGSFRVQISLWMPVSFFMVKPRSVEVEISSVQSSQDVPWVLAKSSLINQLLLA